jgi:hypothetical protein
MHAMENVRFWDAWDFFIVKTPRSFETSETTHRHGVTSQTRVPQISAYSNSSACWRPARTLDVYFASWQTAIGYE